MQKLVNILIKKTGAVPTPPTYLMSLFCVKLYKDVVGFVFF